MMTACATSQSCSCRSIRLAFATPLPVIRASRTLPATRTSTFRAATPRKQHTKSAPRTPAAPQSAPRRPRSPVCAKHRSSSSPSPSCSPDDAGIGGSSGSSGNSGNSGGGAPGFEGALEDLLVEVLRTFYQGTPLFSDEEFNTLHDELEHLGMAATRLHSLEQIWVQATSSRDFDRRLQQEFDLSDDDLLSLKNRLTVAGRAPKGNLDAPSRMTAATPPCPEGPGDADDDEEPWPLSTHSNDAQMISSGERVNERLKWLLFSDASEERLKIMLLYLPAMLMSFVTASIFTILFALLDGEMRITVTAAGRVRLGILSYVVVFLTCWFSNQVTPVMLDYLDLGQPSLLRGACPICGSSVSCLFTGAARFRDERKCNVCGCIVGFNRRWAKVYLVSSPGSQKFKQPD